jgi:hypothetical protein
MKTSNHWFARVAATFILRVEQIDDSSVWIAWVLHDTVRTNDGKVQYFAAYACLGESEEDAKDKAENMLREKWGEFKQRLNKITWEKSDVSDETWENGLKRFLSPATRGLL